MKNNDYKLAEQRMSQAISIAEQERSSRISASREELHRKAYTILNRHPLQIEGSSMGGTRNERTYVFRLRKNWYINI